MIVITEAKVNMMAEVTEEYLEKARMATKANDHSKIRKKSPKPTK